MQPGAGEGHLGDLGAVNAGFPLDSWHGAGLGGSTDSLPLGSTTGAVLTLQHGHTIPCRWKSFGGRQDCKLMSTLVLIRPRRTLLHYGYRHLTVRCQG